MYCRHGWEPTRRKTMALCRPAASPLLPNRCAALIMPAADTVSAVSDAYDAVIVGSGPNGLAAAIELARRGLGVHVIEGHHEIGGGTRTTQLTLPGFLHDVCSTAHPFVELSPFLASLPLSEFGLRLIASPAAVAHPFDDRPPALLERSVEQTATNLGEDAEAYRRLMNPLVAGGTKTIPSALAPLLRIPRHPIALARFGLIGLRSAKAMARRFSTERAKGLIAGIAAHSVVPLNRPFVGGVAATLAMAGHLVGWPIAEGGSATLTRAMADYFTSLGGTIETGRWIASLDELPPTRATLLDVTPQQWLDIAGDRLDPRAKRRHEEWVYGPASFKLDLALDAPIPWRDREVARAATVHVGGTYREIAAGEWETWKGTMPERPFVLLNQPTLFDPSRAPDGKHTAWAYCHVPHRWEGDASEAILGQIERFAPGFRDIIIASNAITPAEYESYNPNNVGGAIGAGAITTSQMVRRPSLIHPYHTAVPDVYLCSAATPPGAGTHGMCGYHAARTALKHSFGKR